MEKDKELYEIWRGVKRRCGLTVSGYSKVRKAYGKKQVSLCKSWLDFEVFKEDMGERPSSDFSVDRIDNSKGYSKSNCRWSTSKEQACNRDTNVFLEYRGKRQTVSQWSEELDLPYSTFSARLENLFKGAEPRGQRIIQRKKETTELLNVFNTCKEAEESSGVSQAAIRKCLCQHNKTAGGFIWEYFKN